MSDRCEHGHDRQHLVDYWWQNDSVAGASWCDGYLDGRRVDHLGDAGLHWIEELQGLGTWMSTGPEWGDGKWVPLEDTE